MIRENQNEKILNNGSPKEVNYEENLATIYDHFCGLSYTHYDVDEMIKKIEENCISRFCEIALDDCNDQEYTLEEFKEYLTEEVINGYTQLK